MVGLDAVNAEALVARTPYGLGSFGGTPGPLLATDIRRAAFRPAIFRTAKC